MIGVFQLMVSDTDRLCVELIRRLKALTYTLLPVEVPIDSLNDPTSRVITPQVISSYIAAAGDYLEAVC